MTLTTRDLSVRLNISSRRVRQLAKSRKIGEQLADETWLFSEDDVTKMMSRKAGRPANREVKK